MQKRFDLLDVKILEGLGIHGPRNITSLARKLGIPAETLRKRMKRVIHSRHFFKTHVNIYHTNLGLKKAIVFAEATPFQGIIALILNSFLANWRGLK